MKTNFVLGLVIGLAIVLIGYNIADAYARNITAYVHINLEAIEEYSDWDNVRWTVDGKNATSFYHDMSDAIYGGEDPEPDLDGFSTELMIPDNATKICLEETHTDDPDYKACDYIKTNQTEFHVIYPASWVPDH